MKERSGPWLDIGLAVLIGLAAATVAFDHVLARYMPNTGDDDTFRSVSAMVAPYREDLLYPCVKRFGFMPDPGALTALPEWRAFITRKTDAFPCEALTRVPIVPVAYNFELHRNLHRAMSAVFGLTGPRLRGFAWYQAIQYGLLLALLYGVFRLGMGRIVAALAMLPLAISPRHLEIAVAPIEYAKAPFFAACLLGVASLVCTRLSDRVAYAVALATGLTVGIGFGFKPDVLVFAPFGLIALALFLRRAPNGGGGRRSLVLAAYLAGVIVAGAPLLRTHFTGANRSLLPIQVLGGMAPVFTQEYVEPPIYDYGIMFDDDHVIAVINSYNQRVNGSKEFGLFFTETIQRGAMDLLVRLQTTFAGDLVLRAYAAILQIFQFVPGGAIAASVVLIGLCRVDLRLALFVAFALVYMVGYTSLVFAPKHYFHLEFVPWWFGGCLMSYGSLAFWRRVRHLPDPSGASGEPLHRSWPLVATAVGTAVALLGGTLGLARAYQDRQVRRLLSSYVANGQIERLSTRSSSTPTSSTMAIPEGVGADEGRTIPEAGTPAQYFTSPTVQTDYLVLRIQCVGGDPGDIAGVYRRPTYWRESLTVPCERPDQAWTVMWPVYQHLPHQVFEGFEYAGTNLLRVNWIGRIRNLDDYPLMLRLRLPDDWAERSLHQTLNLSMMSPARVRPVPAVPSIPAPPLPPPAVSLDPPFVRGLQPLSSAAPTLESWSAAEGVSVSNDSDRVLVQGNSSSYGYQLTSPPVAVPPYSRMVVRVYGDVEQGRVAFGILDERGQRWLLPAVWGRSDFVANIGANSRVSMVFANARQPDDASVASRFTIRSVSYEFQSAAFDRVRSLLWPAQ